MFGRMNMILFILLVFTVSETFEAGNDARRIFGGWDARIEDYPYQAQIIPMPKKKVKPIVFSSCGAAIIGEHTVITAGHCFRKGEFKPKNYLVRVGTSRRDGLGGTFHRIYSIIVHNKLGYFRRAHTVNDLAIVNVDPPFNFGPTVQKIALPKTPVKPGEVAVSTGWGYMDESKTIRPDYLQAAEFIIISSKNCNNSFKWKGKVDTKNICGGLYGNTSTCKGDSGGPLVAEEKLIGVVSWGYSAKCVKKGYPSVFTNVTEYLPWIKSVVEDDGVTYL